VKAYGITGGTGSGKSVAAARLAERGFAVIDADRVGHALIEPGGPAEYLVRKRFGDAIVTDGRIDRKKLGALVFSDSGALRRLNALVWPMLYEAIRRKCERLEDDGHTAVVVDAAILGEDGTLPPWLDGVILVTASDDVRAARLVASRRLTPDAARDRVAAQRPPESKRALARWCIENNGGVESFLRQVDAIAEEIRAEIG